MKEPEPWRIDKNGIPIEPGDLLKTFHFRGGPHCRNYYLYHVATIIDGKLTAIPYAELHTKKDDGGHVVFEIHKDHSSTMEVIDSCNSINLFDERKKVKP